MAEMQLILTYPSIARQVSRHLGFDPDVDNLNDDDLQMVYDCLDGGIRTFLAGGGYRWKFLTVVATLTTESGTSLYDLPDDYGSHIGDMMHDVNKYHSSIQWVGANAIRQRRVDFDTTGAPSCVAQSNLGFSGEGGQRYQIDLYPTPDQAYTLHYTYKVKPDYVLRADTPYTYGGINCSEAVLAACMARADLQINDTVGIWQQQYQSALALAIEEEKRSGPDHLGYNGDNSVGQGGYRNFSQEGTITINGTPVF